MAAIHAGIEHRDSGARATLAGDHGGGALRSAPHDFRIDVVDAVLQRVGDDVRGIHGIGLDVANKRQAAQPLRVADDGERAADTDFEADLRLRGQLTFGATDIGHADNETLLRIGDGGGESQDECAPKRSEATSVLPPLGGRQHAYQQPMCQLRFRGRRDGFCTQIRP